MMWRHTFTGITWRMFDVAKRASERVMHLGAENVGRVERARRWFYRVVSDSQLPDYTAHVDIDISSAPRVR